MLRPVRAWLHGLAIAALAAVYPAARADCVDGVRAATPAEIAFARKARLAAMAALPVPPAGVAYAQGGQPNPDDPPSSITMCRGSKEGAFSSGAGSSYAFAYPQAEVDRLHAERRIVDARIQEVQALPPDLEAERRRFEEQARAVYDQMPRRSRRDPPFTPEQQAEVDRRSAEGRALEDKARAVSARHLASVKPELNALEAEKDRLAPFPQTHQVLVQLNQRTLEPAADTRTARVWSAGVPAPELGAGLRVRNVQLKVNGPPGPVRDALFESVDRAWLQSLVDRGLPELDASRAQLAKMAARPPAPVAAVAPTTVRAAAQPAAPAAAAVAAPAPSAPASSAPAPAAPAPAAPAPAASAPAAPPVASAPPASAPPANCPPPAAQQSHQAANVGATIGGAVFGGGFGRNLGGMIGGAVGAVTQTAPPPGCPN